jgi:asparagine synthase (glutamine-hydrolysing)
MCGIAGFIDISGRGEAEAVGRLTKMTDAIAHRGPDGEGRWVDPEGRVALGHRRLAIIDLSEGGAQPMKSASGRYTIVFNGEIYGFLALREMLASRGIAFRSQSDTEVLLAAVEMFGIEDALGHLTGMFAFALYDERDRVLHFVRDRLGKKPLYIGVGDSALVFGSELKALRAYPAFARPGLNRAALALYLRHGYIPAPHTIHDAILKLPPGCWLSVSVDEPPRLASQALASVKRYWSIYDAASRGHEKIIEDETEALDRLDEVLVQAVRERMISDVPIGAFLSGGIDSTLISAIMQETSATPIKTFTVRFTEQSVNEADFAKAIACRLGTDHMEVTATPEMALATIERLPFVYDEPFADPSQIPTVLVSQLAREQVTVALSGDGGDELFAGYKRYLQMTDLSRMLKRVPPAAFKAISHAPVWLLEGASKGAHSLVPQRYRDEISGDRLLKLAEIFAQNENRRYLEFVSLWKSPTGVVLGSAEPATEMNSGPVPSSLGAIERMMYLDQVAYLPDDILVKVDRASMAIGLEMRAPLLDHRFVELAWRTPSSLRMSARRGKIALYRLLERRVPRELFDRPKQGFSVPLNAWLRGPLSQWAHDMLSPARLRRDGIFDAREVDRCVKEHFSGSRNWGDHLWTILMFNAWADWCQAG